LYRHERFFFFLSLASAFLLIVGVGCFTWPHSVTRTHSVELVNPSQRHSKQTHIHASGEIRNLSPSKRTATAARPVESVHIHLGLHNFHMSSALCSILHKFGT